MGKASVFVQFFVSDIFLFFKNWENEENHNQNCNDWNCNASTNHTDNKNDKKNAENNEGLNPKKDQKLKENVDEHCNNGCDNRNFSK